MVHRRRRHRAPARRDGGHDGPRAPARRDPPGAFTWPSRTPSRRPEPVDPGLRTSARARTAPEAEGGGLDGHVDPWFSPFNTVEMRDDRVLLFADHLPPGVYSYSYTARATTAGTFALPPARAEAMYRPEISGRSDGGTFWIHPAAELAHR
ncbi:MAG: hypothetical protein R3F43_23475 [bacterium]